LPSLHLRSAQSRRAPKHRDGFPPSHPGFPDELAAAYRGSEMRTRAMFAIGTVSFAIPQANAQSPDPALLAPGHSGRMLAPPLVMQPLQ
jgi:hypothetical protein